MKRIDVRLGDPAPHPEAVQLFPKPFQHQDQVLNGFRIDNLDSTDDLRALNSDQQACQVRPANGAPITISHDIILGDRPVAPNVREAEANRYTTAYPGLKALAQDIIANTETETDKPRALIDYAAERFCYDHPDKQFYDGLRNVAAVCKATRVACVDINTFMSADARCLDMTGQYIADYRFDRNKTETRDMRYWLAFEPDRELMFRDFAHHLKRGVEPIAPKPNPAGERRVAMSRGQGLRFETANRQVEVSHFSEPVRVMPDRTTRRPQLRAKVTNRENK